MFRDNGFKIGNRRKFGKAVVGITFGTVYTLKIVSCL